jgi:DNA-binding XRE family transcriptional regulator
MTPEVRAWLHDLRHRDRTSAILVGQAIGMLIEAGPELGRPHSSFPAEQPEGKLRPGSAGPETGGTPMSGEDVHRYTREEFLDEFFPDADDRTAIAAGMEQLRAEQRAYRLAEMRRRLGFSQAQVAARMGVTQGRVSAIENAKPGATELRTIAAYVEALGGRLEIIADFGDQRLAFAEPGTEAA